MDELTIYNVAKDLLDCVHTAIVAAGLPDPCRVCLVPGAEIAWDDCAGGQLAVAVPREFQAEVFPQEALERGIIATCGLPYLVAELTFSLTRCMPIPKGTSLVVPCEAQDAAAQLLLRDAYHMRRALSCCLLELKQDRVIVEYIISSVTRNGPQGACAENEVTVLLGFVNG